MRTKKLKAELAPVLHVDSWVNATAGFGQGFDKASDTFFIPNYTLPDTLLSNLYYGEPIAHRLVDIVPQEMFRRGYCLKSELNPDRAKELQKLGKNLGVDKALTEGMKWGRLFGGAIVILGANDGVGDLTLPLRPDATQELRFLNVVDRRYATVAQTYQDPAGPNYGKPEIYRITAVKGGNSLVHETRCLRFEGIPVDSEKSLALANWTYSVLQLVYDILKKFGTAYDSTSALMADASQAVFKLKGLWEQISRNAKGVQKRMREVDLQRSSARAVLLDTEESFERVPTNFTGLPDVLDRFMMLLSAATGIPVTLLMGRSPAGQNATGDSDFRAFYDNIASSQDKDVSPLVMRVYALFGDVPPDLEVEWLPLYEPTDKEKAETEKLEAETEKLEADTYQVYTAMGAIFPEQVALAEFGKGDGTIEINEAALRASIKAETDLALDPAVTGPAAGEGGGGSSQQIYAYHLQYQILTTNEMRARLGLPSIPGGDVFPEPVPTAPPPDATPALPPAAGAPDAKTVESTNAPPKFPPTP